ncbi:M15 family metallopeptidase [Sphingomonas sp. 2R-10]|uniref:M15 family metallopeptidase n=1 Tax=Sphingomonas sp. 2R-10 TaxID=3045148 RepID=UPI0024BA8BE1|nr:M15 family metallopeptidase [Sphingomonas sp. 2R-10]
MTERRCAIGTRPAFRYCFEWHGETVRRGNGMTPHHIHASVGLGGRNRPADVGIVQTLVKQAGFDPGPIDRRCGRLAIHAIERLQRRLLRHPDGRVDVNGPTWRHLTKAAATPAPAAPGRTIRPSPPGTARPQPAPRTPARPTAPAIPKASPAAPASEPPAERKAFWKAATRLPARNSVNRGLSSPNQDSQIRRFGGRPSAISYKDDGPVTNPKLLRLLVLENVGPFRVHGIRPAVASLRQVFAAVRQQQPELYRLVSNAGMLVNRLQRGSSTKLSNHAFGTAIDLRIAGYLQQRGSHHSNRGLDALAPFFNDAGWYWGATFSVDDAMHFECSTTLLDSFNL